MPNPPNNDTPDKALVERILLDLEANPVAPPPWILASWKSFAKDLRAALSQPQHGGLVEARERCAKCDIDGIQHLGPCTPATLSNSPVVGEDDDLTDEQWAEAVERAPKPNGPLTEISPTDTADAFREDNGDKDGRMPVEAPTDTADRREAIARIIRDYLQAGHTWHDDDGLVQGEYTLADAILSLIAGPPEGFAEALDPWRRVWAIAFAPFAGKRSDDEGAGPLMPTAWPTIGDLRRLAMIAARPGADS